MLSISFPLLLYIVLKFFFALKKYSPKIIIFNFCFGQSFSDFFTNLLKKIGVWHQRFLFEYWLFFESIEHSAIPRFWFTAIIAIFTDSLFHTGYGEPLFLLEYFFDALIVILSLSIVVFSQDFFNRGLNDSRNIFMKLVVLGEHIDFTFKLSGMIPSFQVLFVLINVIKLLEYCIVFSLLPWSRIFKFQNNVDGDYKGTVWVAGMFGREGLVHHGVEIGWISMRAAGTENTIALLTVLYCFFAFHSIFIINLRLLSYFIPSSSYYYITRSTIKCTLDTTWMKTERESTLSKSLLMMALTPLMHTLLALVLTIVSVRKE